MGDQAAGVEDEEVGESTLGDDEISKMEKLTRQVMGELKDVKLTSWGAPPTKPPPGAGVVLD